MGAAQAEREAVVAERVEKRSREILTARGGEEAPLERGVSSHPSIRALPPSQYTPPLTPVESPPAVYVENGGGNPPIFPFFCIFLSFFVHYFLENVTREPPITPRGVIPMQAFLAYCHIVD